MPRNRKNSSRKKKADVRLVVTKAKSPGQLKLPDRLFHPKRTRSSRSLRPKVEPKTAPLENYLPNLSFSHPIYVYPDRGNLHWRQPRDDHPWCAKSRVATCTPRSLRNLVRHRVGSDRARGVPSWRATAAEPVGQGIGRNPKKKCDLVMILKCPYCQKNYRLDASSFREWKSARVRCRKCGKGFTVGFPATEPAEEPPRQPQALTVTRGTPGIAFRPGTNTHISPVSPPETSPQSVVQLAGALEVLVTEEPDTAILPSPLGATGTAGDILSVPTSEAPPTYLLKPRKTPPGNPQNTKPFYSEWQLLVVPAVFVACCISVVVIILLISDLVLA